MLIDSLLGRAVLYHRSFFYPPFWFLYCISASPFFIYILFLCFSNACICILADVRTEDKSKHDCCSENSVRCRTARQLSFQGCLVVANKKQVTRLMPTYAFRCFRRAEGRLPKSSEGPQADWCRGFSQFHPHPISWRPARPLSTSYRLLWHFWVVFSCFSQWQLHTQDQSFGADRRFFLRI